MIFYGQYRINDRVSYLLYCRNLNEIPPGLGLGKFHSEKSEMADGLYLLDP